ncbi:MAG: hypothetical protein Q9O62_09550, partial [Ardenticatenia bacterium]|nr:hypothetical protein [Ardenticatenia bacterium]
MVSQFEAGQPPQKFRVVAGDADVEQLRYRGISVEGRIRARTAATVEVLTYFYPGWRAWLNGEEIPLRPYGIYGHIAFDVPAGEHRVIVRFTDPPLRRAATAATGPRVARGRAAQCGRKKGMPGAHHQLRPQDLKFDHSEDTHIITGVDRRYPGNTRTSERFERLLSHTENHGQSQTHRSTARSSAGLAPVVPVGGLSCLHGMCLPRGAPARLGHYGQLSRLHD